MKIIEHFVNGKTFSGESKRIAKVFNPATGEQTAEVKLATTGDIDTAIENAKKNIHSIPMAGSTIVHTITGEHGSSKVLMKPAAPGTGVIAGGAARQVLEAAGIKDILAKSLGSPTHLNVAKATLNGLLNQRTPDMVAALRGKKTSEVAPQGLVEAFEKTKAERRTNKQVADGES